MPDYRKLIRPGRTPEDVPCNLYKHVADSSVTYSLAVAGHTIAMYADKGAALARWEGVRRGDPWEPPRNPDAVAADAEHVRRHPQLVVEQPTFAVLARLEYDDVLARGRSTGHARVCLTVAKIVGEGAIPTTEGAFSEWLRAAVGAIESRAETRSAQRLNLSTFARCLRQVEDHSGAFKKLVPLLGYVRGAVRRAWQRPKAVVANRAPFTRGELTAALNACSSFADVALVLVYCTLGCRAGEGERARLAHVVNGKYVLGLIQTKTQTDRRPPAPPHLIALLPFAEGGKVPGSVDRKRFRATCGVYLALGGGASELEIATRLGHRSTRMVASHYVTQYPADYGGHQQLATYFELPRVDVGGVELTGHSWDRYVALLALQHGRKWDSGFRDALLQALRGPDDLGTAAF